MQSIKVSIDQLLLDPNNYRIHSHKRYTPVKEISISNPLVQKRVRDMLEGDNREDIKDLIDSFKTNGYLRIDNILIRDYEKENDKFVVIEGNRRVAALKALKDDFDRGFDIGNLSSEIFQNLEVVFYDLDEEAYLLLMGLRHVSGVKEWGDYEQSELIMNLSKNFRMDITEISNRLGMKKQEVKRRINSFIAMEIFKEDEEYGEFFRSSMAGVFYELMSKPNFRDWLEWDESVNSFKNKKNLKRFFSWLSPTEDRSAPIIQKRDDIREVNKFIKDEEALDTMEEKNSISEALEQSSYFTEQGFKSNIKSIKKSLDRIPFNALLNMDKDTRKELKEIVKSIEAFKKILDIGDKNE
ncbi:ParB N-terminal domain-containing protein [Bacillus sp. FJAT-42315]|uniref:ParB N-terminal domain-containing protein n=1 Tax=Bacillus sp. FJAT-42315 TaxID=2014077 RepID=UPI000C24932C|nr:ParB N-terminal domain-containing protein [Bacillus sp. FJAT-42315]